MALKKNLFFVLKPFLSHISKFREKHIGESCYLIGNGISLKWFDLKFITDKPTFTLNYFIAHKIYKDLNINYNMILEPFFFYPFNKIKYFSNYYIINRLQFFYREQIKKNPDKIFFTNLSNYPVLSYSNIYYLYLQFPHLKKNKDIFFEECKKKNINYFYGSFRSTISLAIYMGFKKIILIGCDYTHEKTVVGHFYEKGKGKSFNRISIYEKDFLEIATKYVTIVTITKSGKGSFLPSLTYEEFAGKKMFFRENLDLCDMSFLNLANKHPEYKIF